MPTLRLEDFPHPQLARALSVNGRAHWTVRSQARGTVYTTLAHAVQQQGIQPLPGPARVRITYTFPLHRTRDPDNATGGGVSKAALDALVRLGILAGDDTAHLFLEPVEIRVEKGVRRMEIQLEEMS